MKMNNTIAAIIVTYNRKKLLREAIDALLKQTYINFDIFIIDNASTDDTFAYIQDMTENDRVYYINTGENLGGAGGFHFGIKEAVTRDYKKIWIMDDDTIATPNALQELLDAEEILQGAYGFLCSDVKWTDGAPCAMNVPNVSNKWIQQTEFLQNGILRVDQCSFVSCFFTADIVRKAGLPIKEFFVWGDDAEYTKRISNIKESYFIPKSIVVHKMNSNIPTDISQDSPDRLFRYKFSYRNMYYVNKRHGSKLSMLLYYYGIFLDIKKIFKSKQKGKWKKIKIILKGIHDGKKFAPDVEYI
ncbi:glycosyltransferase family 2 protein [[Clostridium] innocuum]|nr:glycosyltransferase family 2 protein [[Clostridium] innocuum]